MPAIKKIRVESFDPLTNSSTVNGVVAVTQGGTGATSASAALTNLLPNQGGYSGYYLNTNGVTAVWAAVSGGGGGSTVPKITAINITDSSYNVLNDTAINTAGGYIQIVGTDFVAGCSVIINNISATSVAFVSSTTLNCQIPALSAGTYIVYVVNPDGGVGVRVNGLTASDLPNWQTASSLTAQQVDTAINITLVATDATSYVLQAGSSLPPGLSLSSGGVISGTVTGITVETLYTFTIVAIDAQLQDSPRTFTITISANDPYFTYNALLLRSELSTDSFAIDSSTNKFNVTINGDTKGSKFTPYLTGWSNYFDGNGDFIDIASNSAFNLSGDFTIELWVNTTKTTDSWLTGYYVSNPLVVSNIEFIVAIFSGNYILSLNSGSTETTFQIGTTSQISNGNWHHIACVRSSNTVRTFLNGTLVTTTAYSSTLNNPGSAVLRIGGVTGTFEDAYFGYISNLRIVNGTALYATNFTPSTTPLTAVANTSLLTCQSNRFIDNSTNNFTITRNGDTAVSSYNPFNLYNTGTGGSAYFTASEGLTLASNAAFNIGTGNFTVEGWFYSQRADEASNPINIAWTIGTINGANAASGGVSNTAIQYRAGGSSNVLVFAASLGNSWNHIAWVRNSGVIYFYLNGTQVASANNTTSISSSGGVIISYPNNANYRFSGYISNIRFNNTAVYTANFTPPTSPLTAIANTSLLTCQYSQASNNNTFLDGSYYNNIVTRNGNTTTSTFTPFYNNYSVYFDGSGDWLVFNGSNSAAFGTSPYTIEGWFYLTSISAIRQIFDCRPTQGAVPWGCEFTSGSPSWYNGASNTSASAVTINTWNHVAWVREGTSTNQAKIYINGVVAHTFTDTTNYGTMNVSSRIGLNISDVNPFVGYMSNLRIVKGTAVYTGNFTPSVTPLTAIANTSLLTCLTNKFQDLSTNNFTITPNGDSKVTKYSPFTLSNRYSVEQYGGSMYFDGNGDYLVITSNNLATTGDLTIEAWMYLLSASSYGGIFSMRSTGSGNPGFNINILNTGFIEFCGGSTNLYNGTAAPLNTWTHVALVRSGSATNNCKCYVNGVLVGQFTSTGQASGVTNTAVIGRYYADGTNQYWTTGYISNVRYIVGTALYTTNFTPPTTPVITPTVQTSLLLTGSAAGIYDATGINAVETAGNAELSNSVTKYLSSSLYFDGTGDWLLIPNNVSLQFGTGSFTVEFWVYITGGATNVFRAMVSKGAAATGWSIFMSNTNVWGYTDTNINTLSTTAPVYNTWTYVTFVRSGTSAALYINGVSVASSTSSTNFNQTEQLVVGAGRALDIPFTGYISDLRITNGIARYTTNFTPPTAPNLTI